MTTRIALLALLALRPFSASAATRVWTKVQVNALIPWVPIHTSSTLGNGQFPFTDAEATNSPQRFHRVVKP